MKQRPTLLQPGTTKLGNLIRHFSLPSRRKAICRWLSKGCKVCYDRRLEKFRPTIKKQRERNYRASQLADFEAQLQLELEFFHASVVRIHVGGEFYSEEYLRKWLRLVRANPKRRFFLYTRAWRDTGMRLLLEKLAELPNVRVWFSCDAGTGLPPERLHPNVRLAWLQLEAEEVVPPEAHLIFRDQRHRSKPDSTGGRICPHEDGSPESKDVTCSDCGYCWQGLKKTEGPLSFFNKCRRRKVLSVGRGEGVGKRISLPVLVSL